MHSPEIKVLEEKRNVSAQKSISRTSPTNIFRIEYAHNQRKVTKKQQQEFVLLLGSG